MAQNSKKVIIVGKTGNGKSSLGNSLLGLGKKYFREGGGFKACSMACQRERNGQFEIVDTPGLFDSHQNQNLPRQAEKILEALKLCPKPHAFLIVIKYCRFTAEEISVLDVLAISFGEQYLDHAIVVFTHVDNDVTATDFSNACQESQQVNTLLIRCKLRVVRIDNKNPKEEHVNTLLQYIDQVSEAGNSCFKNDYLHLHEEVLNRCAQDLEKYDSMLVHEQVEQIVNEIKTMVKEEVKKEEKEREESSMRERAEREERAMREKEEREERAMREREEREERAMREMEEREERAMREREEREEREKERKKKEDMETKMTISAFLGSVASVSAGFIIGRLFNRK